MWGVQVCRVVDEHMRFSKLENTIWGGGAADGSPMQNDADANVWQLFFQEGNIRMYRRELEREGRVIDPLKAIHLVKGTVLYELHILSFPELMRHCSSLIYSN